MKAFQNDIIRQLQASGWLLGTWFVGAKKYIDPF